MGDYDVIRCEPKKSTDKCGAVLLAFPEADKNNIEVECTSTKCYFRKLGVAKLEPSMVKCAGSKWKLGTNEVIENPAELRFRMITFQDFEVDIVANMLDNGGGGNGNWGNMSIGGNWGGMSIGGNWGRMSISGNSWGSMSNGGKSWGSNGMGGGNDAS